MTLNCFTKLLLPAAMMIAAVAVNTHAQNAKPFTVPEIQEWKGGDGTVEISTANVVVANVGTEAVAKALVTDLDVLAGIKIGMAEKSKNKTGDIVLKLVKDKKMKDEAYAINVGDKVELTATTTTGLYWGTRTLLQMLDGNAQKTLAKGVIKDNPDFQIRGFMIDCARKYIPITYLRQLVKIMSYYKMNCLQVHLNDNGFPKYFEDDWKKTYAAFRLECDTYPGLAARDGHYTKAEFRDLQKLGMELGVEVLPEIDAPAHCLAFTHYAPELGSTKYGVDHLDITNPKSLEFMEKLWDEYLGGPDPVFIGPRVHIGTDEFSNRDQDVVELFRGFADRLIKKVESYGKQACMWGSLTHAKGQTPVKSENVIMSFWYNGYAKPDSMVAIGYKGISIPDGLTYIVPHAGYYYDYLNTKYLYESWTPNTVGNVNFAYDNDSILGGMFAVWNDVCGNGISVKDVHHRVYPAMQTLSAKFWTGKNVTVPFAEFDKKRLTLQEAPGVNELGRIKGGFSKTTLAPNSDNAGNGNVEVGYNYSVEFELIAAQEEKGTVLLESPNAKFYLADPINGRLAYERDGYLYTFDYAPYPGERAKICIEGTNKATYLYIDGKLAEAKTGRTYLKEDKNKVMTIETLVFPLQKSGNFKSSISNFTVADALKYTK